MTERPRSMRKMTMHALALLMAATLLPACSPGQGGGPPGGTSSGPATPGATSSSTPTDSGTEPATPAPDLETSVPAPAPEPSRVPSSGPGEGNAELAVTVIPSEGEPEVNYTLVCVAGVPAAESSHPSADAACAAIKANAALLSRGSESTDQACTEQYGGPQKATVTGVVDGVAVEAQYSRTNGCEISAWDAAKDVLGTPGGAA